MALVDLKTDLSKLKRDSFTSDIENKSKGIASGLNLDFGSFQPIHDKFKEGVPQPNLDFGGSLDKPTPTVPTSMPGTPEKSSIVPKSFIGTPEKPSQVPRSFDATLDKPTPTIPTSFAGTPDKLTQPPRSFNATLDKPVPAIPTNWSVFADLADKVSMFGEVNEPEVTGLLVSGTRGALDFVNYFSDIHATGFTGNRLFGDVRYPEGSEYIGIGSYENPGRLWFNTTPRGQLHAMWDSNFPTLDTHPHDEGISNPYYSSRNKLYGALEGWSNTQGTFFKYFKRNQNEIDFASRGTLKSAWDHGSVKLSIDDTGIPGIETNQYTKHSKTHLFPKGLLGDFTSFPDIPSKMDTYPPSILTIPRGGPVLTVKRGLKDVERHAKWFLSTKGIIWGVTQAGLQLLNPRPETRIWNPLSLGSVMPLINIPRHLQKIPLGINLQKYGVKTGLLGGPMYTEARDYVDAPDLGDRSNIGASRLTSFLNTYIYVDPPNEVTAGSKRVNKALSKLNIEIPSGQDIRQIQFGIKKRQTPGQYIYLVPGRGGIFGAIPNTEVGSRKPIHIGEKVPHHLASSYPSSSLGTYKTLAYGDLKRLDELDQRRGSITQFDKGDKSYLFTDDPAIEPLEKRYKLGDPGKPGLERSSRIDGVNAKKGDKLDTIDLLNAQGYISKGNVDGGTSFTADGKKLPFTEIKPTTEDYPDLIPLNFYDVENKAWILFRAYIGKFNDTISPSWSSTEIAGRPVPQYYYQKTERKISFDFKVAAMTKHELAPMWQKLNYLVGLCYPSFTNSVYPTMINPFIKLTLGDVFHHVPGFLTTLTVSPIDNISWELIRDPKRGLARVPMGMNVSLDFTYVGDSMPSQTSPNHYLHATYDNWIDHTNSFWGTQEQKISYPADIRKKDK